MDEPARKKSYSSVQVYTTFRCTFTCARCSQRWHYDKELPTLSWAMFALFVDRLRQEETSIRRFVFTGGEPTLWPHLRRAVDLVHGHGWRAEITTNGFRAAAKDYGNADVVRISNYGGQNNLDQWRLRRDLGRRCRIYHPVHIDYPLPDGGPACLPARCSCQGLALIGQRVYACPSRALRAPASDGVCFLEEGWLPEVGRRHSLSHSLCRICPGNQNNCEPFWPPLTLQAGLWLSNFGFMLSLPWQGRWLRQAWRRWKQSH